MKKIRNITVRSTLFIKLFFMFIMISYFSIAIAETSNTTQISDTSNEVSIIYKFEKPTIVQKNRSYYSVSIKGMPSYGTPGAPVFPVKTAKILLPKGGTIKDIKVIPLNEIHIGDNFLIEYSTEPVTDGREIVSISPNPEIYNSSFAYPEKIFKIVSTQRLHGCDILLVNIYPVKYIPKSGSLYYFDEIEVKALIEKSKRYSYGLKKLNKKGLTINEIKKLKSQTDFDENNNLEIAGSDDDYICILDNDRSDFSGWSIDTEMNDIHSSLLDNYKYVIITNEELEPAFQTLRDFKETRGHNPITATIKTIEDIYVNYSGSDNQEKIRNFIIDAYNNWGTEYVLLGGDVEIIPHRGMYVHRTGYYERIDEDIPCDMYYGCLDGNWNYDGDDLFGEPTDGIGGGEIDLFAEVFVGRAPVNTPEEAINFVDKTIAHETEIDEERLRRAVLVGEELDYMTWGGNKLELINSILAPYTTTCLFERDANFDSQYLRNKLDNADFQFIVHEGHSYVDWTFENITRQDVLNLENAKYYLIYDNGCYANAFDNRDQLGNYGGDSISEFFVKHEHGAFGFIGNTRYGWYGTGDSIGPGEKYAQAFFEAICNKNINNIGQALQDAKESLAGLLFDEPFGCYRWMYYCLNLLGDPETNLVSEFVTPCADISQPDGSSPVMDNDTIIIKGTAKRSRHLNATFTNYIIEYGIGIDPTDWHTDKINLINNGYSEVTADVLAEWDTSDLDKGRYTIKLKAFDADGNFTEDRQIVPLVWPRAIEGTVTKSIKVGDIDNNGTQEIFIGSWRYFHAFYHDGSELPGWPNTFSPYSSIDTTFALGDLNNDGSIEILNATYGRIFVWNVDGTYFDGDNNGVADWPKEMEKEEGELWEHFMSDITLADIDSDGELEIICGYMNKLYAWNGDGSDVDADNDGIADWPVEIEDKISTSAAIGDIDNDGSLDIVIATLNGYVYAFSNEGVLLNNWPFRAQDKIFSSPALADFDKDNDLEIVFGSDDGYVYVLNHDCSLFSGWPIDTESDGIHSSPSIGDVDGDGDLEIAIGTDYPNFAVFVWHHDGILLNGWPVHTGEKIYSSPAIGDIDGNGDREIIAGSWDNKVYAWHHDGTIVSGWPKKTGHAVNSSPCIADIDGDGLVEVAIGSDDRFIYVYDTNGVYRPENIEWGMFQHDERNTGCYPSEVNSPPIINPLPDQNGNEGELLEFTVNASDIDMDALIFSAEDLPDGASFTQTVNNPGYAEGVFSWTPDYTQAGVYSGIRIGVTDGELIDFEDIAITVHNVNRAPIANSQSVTTAEDTAKQITLTGNDPDGDSLTFSIYTQPAHGTISGTPPNITYTPVVNYNGTDSLTFRVYDGSLYSSPATVSITVNPVNDPPVANPQSVTTNEDTAKSITLTGSDPEGSSLTYSIVTQPSHGTLSGTAPNVTYTPVQNYNGSDSFTFKVYDGSLYSSPATVSITVNPVNNAPVLAPIGNKSVNENRLLTFTLSATDPDGDTLAFSAIGLPSGAVLNSTTGVFSWTPTGSQVGSYTVTFIVIDNGVPYLQDSETIIITVINLPPPTPKNLQAKVVQKKVQLKWGAVSDPNLKGYNVYRAKVILSPSPGIIKWVKIATVNVNYYIDTPGSGAYYYKVNAVDKFGLVSGFSNIVSVKVPSSSTPSPQKKD